MQTDEIDRVIAGLTKGVCSALSQFEPGTWYGQCEPSKAVSYVKGKMTSLGLLKHDGGQPTKYTLTRRGLAIRNRLKELETRDAG